MTEAVVIPDDDFDKAFAEAANAVEAPAAKVEPEVKAEPEVKVKPAAKVEPEVKAEPAAKVEPEVKAEPAAKVEPEVKVEPAAKVEPEVKVKPAAPAETPEQKKAREDFEATIAPYEPTEEEKAALAKFKDDFPNEFAAVEARLKGVDREINARVYKAVQGVLQQVYKDVTPIAEGFQATSAKQHFTEIRQAHADYDTVVGAIPEWIKKQPAYLQPAMQAVYDGGDTASVIALVADYKKATGTTPAPAAPVAAVVTRPTGVDDLTPVGAKRTTPVPRGQPDPNDFDAAFNEAATL